MPVESSTGPVDSYVYFMQAEGSGLIKIGYSTDPRKRLAQLATMSPEPIHLVAVHPGDRTLEQALHARFRQHRARGEWFYPNPELIALINTARDVMRIPTSDPMARAEEVGAQFGLSAAELTGLANRGLISRSKVGKNSWYRPREIQDLIELKVLQRPPRRKRETPSKTPKGVN